jgi:bifunctional non-homologous end joining protein LigD
MPLIRVPEAFDHPDWLFELKHDGFRALAVIDGHRCRLVSRGGHVFKQWPLLAEEVAHAVRAHRAVLDGEIVCLRPNGASDFNALLLRRDWPVYYAFDALEVEGEDLREKQLLMRKRWLKAVMPRIDTRLRYVDHVRGRGRALFAAACAHDTEGIVAKWARGRYHADGATTSWLKIKNPAYSQMEGRAELFDARGGRGSRQKPRYRFDSAAAPVIRKLIQPL